MKKLFLLSLLAVLAGCPQELMFLDGTHTVTYTVTASAGISMVDVTMKNSPYFSTFDNYTAVSVPYSRSYVMLFDGTQMANLSLQADADVPDSWDPLPETINVEIQIDGVTINTGTDSSASSVSATTTVYAP